MWEAMNLRFLRKLSGQSDGCKAMSLYDSISRNLLDNKKINFIEFLKAFFYFLRKNL